MRNRKTVVVICAAILFMLALTVPLQYLTRREVVVGLPSDTAHSHAHGEGEDSHAAEDSSEGENGQEESPAAGIELGVNLIPNFGFEAGTYEQIWGWFKVGTGQGETIYRDLSIAHLGLASAAVSTNGAVIDDAGWVTKIDALPVGYDVVVEGYIKTQALVGVAYLKVTLETKEEGKDEPLVLGWAFTGAVAGDSDWTLVNARIHVPAEATGVWLEARIQGQGKAWFDDLTLTIEEAV